MARHARRGSTRHGGGAERAIATPPSVGVSPDAGDAPDRATGKRPPRPTRVSPGSQPPARETPCRLAGSARCRRGRALSCECTADGVHKKRRLDHGDAVCRKPSTTVRHFARRRDGRHRVPRLRARFTARHPWSPPIATVTHTRDGALGLGVDGEKVLTEANRLASRHRLQGRFVVLREKARSTHVDGAAASRSARRTRPKGVAHASVSRASDDTYGGHEQAGVASGVRAGPARPGAAADAMVVKAEAVDSGGSGGRRRAGRWLRRLGRSLLRRAALEVAALASEAVSFAVEDGDDDDEEDEVVAAVTSLLDGDAAEPAVEVLPVSAVAADAEAARVAAKAAARERARRAGGARRRRARPRRRRPRTRRRRRARKALRAAERRSARRAKPRRRLGAPPRSSERLPRERFWNVRRLRHEGSEKRKRLCRRRCRRRRRGRRAGRRRRRRSARRAANEAAEKRASAAAAAAARVEADAAARETAEDATAEDATDAAVAQRGAAERAAKAAEEALLASKAAARARAREGGEEESEAEGDRGEARRAGGGRGLARARHAGGHARARRGGG